MDRLISPIISIKGSAQSKLYTFYRGLIAWHIIRGDHIFCQFVIRHQKANLPCKTQNNVPYGFTGKIIIIFQIKLNSMAAQYLSLSKTFYTNISTRIYEREQLIKCQLTTSQIKSYVNPLYIGSIINANYSGIRAICKRTYELYVHQ